MNDIIDQIEVHLNHLKVAKDCNDLDGFYSVLKELTEYAFAAEVPE